MQEIYLLARHTPFWAIPIAILGAEFAYLFWLKKKKVKAVVCLWLVFIGLSSTIFYVWSGGPDKSVKMIKKLKFEYFSDKYGF